MIDPLSLKRMVIPVLPDQVREIARRYSTAPPVDVASIARELGLEVFAKALPAGVSGMLKRDPSFGTTSGFVCFVDKDEPSFRQRFTAAHEIGHFVLHRHKIGDQLEDNYMLRAAGMSSKEETEANNFAADLLMPWHLINDEMKQGPKSVEDLANIFNVSRIAMAIRLGVPT